MQLYRVWLRWIYKMFHMKHIDKSYENFFNGLDFFNV